jgi:hypothetical protein
MAIRRWLLRARMSFVPNGLVEKISKKPLTASKCKALEERF